MERPVSRREGKQRTMWPNLREYLDEQFTLALPGVDHVHFVGGLLSREASRRPDRGRVSVSGKGFTQESALSGCMGETAEYLSFLERPDDPLVVPAAEAGQLGPIAAWVEGRPDVEALLASDKLRCRLLPGDTPLDLPVSLVLRCPAGTKPQGQTSSNGLGAGRDLEAAKSHAALELVERHSVLCWWWTQDLAPDIDPTALCAALPEAGFEEGDLNNCPGIWFKLLTGPLEVPVAGAFAADSTHSPVACGFAAGFTLAQAIRGAYLEMRHAELGYRLGFSRPLPGRPGQVPLMPRYSEHRCLNPVNRVADTPEEVDGLTGLLARCAASGARLAWADLTRADIGAPVVRVIADNLQGPNAGRTVPSMRRLLADAGITEGDVRSLPSLY